MTEANDLKKEIEKLKADLSSKDKIIEENTKIQNEQKEQIAKQKSANESLDK